MDLKNISDDTLHAETIRLFGRERTAIAEAVEYLAEVSRRRSYLKYGVPSLYRYGMTHLGLSEFSALQRSRAARLAAEFPEAIAKLRDGRLTLCAASEAWRAFEEQRRLAAEIEQAPELGSAATTPAPVQASMPGIEANSTPTQARPLARTEKRAVLQSLEGRSRDEIRKTLSAIRPGSGATRPRPRAAWMGHQGEWRELRLHFSEAERIQLDRLRSLLSHKIPGGDLTEVVMRLVAEGLERHDPERVEARAMKRREKRASEPAAPPARPPVPDRDALINHGQGSKSPNRVPIPAAIRRQVLIRDGLRCQYPAWHGHGRCLSSWSVDVDHVLPRSHGGPNSPGNLRAACAAHNRNRQWIERSTDTGNPSPRRE